MEIEQTDRDGITVTLTPEEVQFLVYNLTPHHRRDKGMETTPPGGALLQQQIRQDLEEIKSELE